MPSTKTSSPPLDVELLLAAAASDGELVSEITDLVNSVYATAEAGLSVDRASRTSATKVAEILAAWQITVAWIDRQIVGTVRIQQLDAGTGCFGMLVGEPAHWGRRLGRELVDDQTQANCPTWV